MRLTYKSVNEFELTCATIRFKAIEHYFHVLIMVYLKFGLPGSERTSLSRHTSLTGYNVVLSQESFPSDR